MKLHFVAKGKGFKTEFKQSKCPFPKTEINCRMYHGSAAKKLNVLKRKPEGIWFTKNQEYQSNLIGEEGELYTCWLDVRNPYHATEADREKHYEKMNHATIEFFETLRKKGFDAYVQGDKAGSIAIFEHVKIMNVVTGEYM